MRRLARFCGAAASSSASVEMRAAAVDVTADLAGGAESENDDGRGCDHEQQPKPEPQALHGDEANRTCLRRGVSPRVGRRGPLTGGGSRGGVWATPGRHPRRASLSVGLRGLRVIRFQANFGDLDGRAITGENLRSDADVPVAAVMRPPTPRPPSEHATATTGPPPPGTTATVRRLVIGSTSLHDTGGTR
jgi:hypothetical protein